MVGGSREWETAILDRMNRIVQNWRGVNTRTANLTTNGHKWTRMGNPSGTQETRKPNICFRQDEQDFSGLVQMNHRGTQSKQPTTNHTNITNEISGGAGSVLPGIGRGTAEQHFRQDEQDFSGLEQMNHRGHPPSPRLRRASRGTPTFAKTSAFAKATADKTAGKQRGEYWSIRIHKIRSFPPVPHSPVPPSPVSSLQSPVPAPLPTWILNIGYWILDIVSPRPQSPVPTSPLGHWTLNIGHWILNIVSSLPPIRVHLCSSVVRLFGCSPLLPEFMSSHSFPLRSSPHLEIGHWILNIEYCLPLSPLPTWTLDIGYWILDIVSSLLPIRVHPWFNCSAI